MSSDWSDTMVWFGQILLYLHFYHPIYIILAAGRFEASLCCLDRILDIDQGMLELREECIVETAQLRIRD